MKNSKTVQKIGLLTAISYVIANMVGTGVFTSLGFQLAGGVTDVAAVMILWLMGGIIAFTGAQVYGELGSVCLVLAVNIIFFQNYIIFLWDLCLVFFQCLWDSLHQ